MTNFDPYAGTITVHRTARKAHQCSTCRVMIRPGERYIDSVIPPWTMIKDDPDYPAHPFGEWERGRYHVLCPHLIPKPAPTFSGNTERPEAQRLGGGIDPMRDYLWAKGEL